jgi:kexin
MRLAVFLLSLLPFAYAHSHSRRDYDNYDYYAIHLDASASPQVLADHLGLEYDGIWSILDDHHIFRSHKQERDIVDESKQRLKARRNLKRDLGHHLLDNIHFNQKQVPRRRLFKRGIIPAYNKRSAEATEAAIAERAALAKSLTIEDPIFNEQWHLFNAEMPGNDMNVGKVWLQGITGKNATVCIIDDGLDFDSLDLKPNYFAEGSWDFNDKGPQPKPKLIDDQHGTRCAGEVAAAKNNVCGVGVAYDARISGVRILSAPISDLDEAEAVQYKSQLNDIYSCSWGPPDDGRTMDAPGVLIKQAMQKAIQEGRDGKGSIYVFAVGNGAASGDNCNFDGYTNSIFSVSIGAVDRNKKHPYYSEACSAQLAVTYSSGAGESIHTTDVGVNQCTKAHGGTSAAGPLVSGVYALVLQVRPEATWRDIQWLTALSSQPFYDEEPESEWQITASGQKFSHQFGYGIVDTYAITELAKTWTLVKKQAWYFSPWVHVRHPIPEGDAGLTSTFEVTQQMLQEANLERVEHVTVTMNVQHTRRGDLSVELHSPQGIISYLATARTLDDAAAGYVDWTFMSVAHFGESGIGKWTVVIRDTVANQKTGTFTDWRLKLYGESIDSAKQGLLPMPQENEDDNHDQDVAIPPGTTTQSTQSATPTSIIISSPLPTRPTIVKPTNAAQTSSSANNPSTTTSGTAPPTASPVPPAQEPATSDPLLPSPFPTFGVSRSTQAWIYGALGLILAFCAGLTVYLYVQRRKRMKSSRDNYEFAMLEDQEETDGMLETKGRRRRRAGELYDAFAGESDEELFSSSDGEGDDGVYRDDDDADGRK